MVSLNWIRDFGGDGVMGGGNLNRIGSNQLRRMTKVKRKVSDMTLPASQIPGPALMIDEKEEEEEDDDEDMVVDSVLICDW